MVGFGREGGLNSDGHGLTRGGKTFLRNESETTMIPIDTTPFPALPPKRGAKLYRYK
jgi:hypothetical protein